LRHRTLQRDHAAAETVKPANEPMAVGGVVEVAQLAERLLDLRQLLPDPAKLEQSAHSPAGPIRP
jgi:hypothetical protein